MHLATSKSASIYHDKIDFLLRETFNWFKYSTIRKAKYKKIYDLININEKENKFYNFVKLSETRWLARYNCVKVILDQYLELQTFFSMVVNDEKCYTTRLLCAEYKNEINKVTLLFICPILKQLNNLNLYFQNDKIDFNKAYDEITSFMIK